MSVFILLVRIIIGAVVGWIVGTLLTRVMFTLENYRLTRKMNRLKNRKLQSVA